MPTSRCALSFKALLELTSIEHHRWHEWFAEHPEAWALAFATERMATVGGVVLHIFAVHLQVTQRLLGERVSGWEEFNQSTVEGGLELGENTRGQLVQFLDAASDEELDNGPTFQTLTAQT